MIRTGYIPDRRLFVPPKQPEVEGAIVFCPICYPGIGLTGPQRHYGDLSHEFPGGDKVDVYEGAERLEFLERALKPGNGPVVLQEWALIPGTRTFARCPGCRQQYLRRLRVSRSVVITFREGFPDAYRPCWAPKKEDESNG